MSKLEVERKLENIDLSIEKIEAEISEAFNGYPLITRRCTAAINSLILACNKKELPSTTLKNIFILILRAFQSKEVYLKNVVYLAIEKISSKVNDSFLAINILHKDLSTVKDDMKPKCLRTLFSVIPEQMLADFEKILAQSYESNRMAPIIYYDLIHKNKINMNISDISGSTYHQIALVFELKKNDRKFLLDFLKKNQYCKDENAVFMVRLAFYLYSEDRKLVSEFIKRFLTIKYNEEMVFIEAANNLLNLQEEEIIHFLNQAVQSLRSLLRSKNLILKFASIRTLNKLSKKFPSECSIANPEIEDLINDRNNSINVLALTTILQTCTEDSIDGFVTKLSNIDMNDSYKYLLFDSITSLCTKFPKRTLDFLKFYKSSLAEKSSLEFKIFLLKKIENIICYQREEFIGILCEYIEDSQHFSLTINILGILSRELLMILQPKRYLIHILNRLILENNHVRAAALQALYNISSIIDFNFTDILKKCSMEEDEMISETALFLLKNRESGEDLRKEELYDYKDSLEMYFVQEKVSENKIKECRELVISEKDCDVKVSVIKDIFEHYIVVKIVVENTLGTILLKNGKLVVLMRTKTQSEEFTFTYKNLRAGKRQINEIRVEGDYISSLIDLEKENFKGLQDIIVFNSLIDYELCPENDLNDIESETLDLNPFEITFIDTFVPKAVDKEIDYTSSTSYILNCKDVEESLQNVLKILNLKVVSKSKEDSNQVILEGIKGNINLRVIVDIWYNVNIHVNIDAFSNKKEISDAVVSIFG